MDVEIALARLREAQTSLQQRIDFAALHADRTIDLPIGDLSNPT